MTRLAGGGWRADVDPARAVLTGLRHDAGPGGASVEVLVPWPAPDSADTGHAWQLAVSGDDWLTLGTRLHDGAGRPLGLAAQLSYSLGDDGLTVLLENFNVGEAPVVHGCAVDVRAPGVGARAAAGDDWPRDERARAATTVGDLEVWWGPSLPWARVSSAVGATQVRPSSCADDARDTGADLVELLPGHAHVATCGVRLART